MALHIPRHRVVLIRSVLNSSNGESLSVELLIVVFVMPEIQCTDSALLLRTNSELLKGQRRRLFIFGVRSLITLARPQKPN